MTKPLLAITDLCKSYAVPVLKGVNFDVKSGEVHALVGANGAGKSTLCNIICGLVPYNSGVMKIRGEKYTPKSVKDSEQQRIGIVMQELNLIDNLSIAENLFLTEMPKRHGLINYKKLYADANQILASIGLNGVDAKEKVIRLGIGQKQLIEIARVLINPCDILILDEPTAALTDDQIELFYKKIIELKAQGVGIIYISHRMKEISYISDRITVLTDGKAVSTSDTANVSIAQTIKDMTGGLNLESFQRTSTVKIQPVLEIRNLSTEDLLRDINLNINKGEILGISGLVGSGRTELLRALFGADAATGSIQFNGQEKRYLFRSPEEAVANGIGLIPEDRKQQGLLLSQPISTNIAISAFSQFRNKIGWLKQTKLKQRVAEYIRSLGIKCNHAEQKVSTLSGGNQQKISIAKWLLKDSDILLFDEPTRGIDIHTKESIYKLLERLAEQGKAIVIVSSESNELTAICDRIAVLSNGCLADIFARDEWSPEKLTAASFSAYITTDAA